MKLFIFSLFITFLSNSAFSDDAIEMATSNLCTTDEQILFSCQLWNKKIVSICASKKDQLNPFAEYRYGSLKKTELIYQASAKYPQNKIYLLTTQQKSELKPSYIIFFQNHNYGYSLDIPYTSSTNEYDNPKLFVNNPNWADADWNEYGCVANDSDKKWIINLLPNTPELTNATTHDFDKWVKKFGKRSYAP
ncbi:M15 family metallopeptidase [Sulfuriferula nivalis]|uniref:Uncharacterized protein n=1 Tax=Sulfuriferula nivalis TaxID=2675298 RepID=A0A809S459_9PROT|nr:M15 family metallopeptidase [Sulfuriferula nivalis]BBP01668.1 hypothetical protein SFSGTM_23760 [Sulfuriferula nivalis]